MVDASELTGICSLGKNIKFFWSWYFLAEAYTDKLKKLSDFLRKSPFKQNQFLIGTGTENWGVFIHLTCFYLLFKFIFCFNTRQKEASNTKKSLKAPASLSCFPFSLEYGPGGLKRWGINLNNQKQK